LISSRNVLLHDFWRYPVRRADDCACLHSLFIELRGEAEIAYLLDALWCEENIAFLNISIDLLEVVNLLNGVYDALHNCAEFDFREFALEAYVMSESEPLSQSSISR
jgi:hypothetical protein